MTRLIPLIIFAIIFLMWAGVMNEMKNLTIAAYHKCEGQP